MNVWRLAWAVTRHKPRYFWAAMVFFIGFFTVPAAFGYVLAVAFNALQDGEVYRVYQLAVLLVVIEIVRMTFLHYGALRFHQSWEFMRGLLRGNLLRAQLSSGGRERGRPVSSAGAAVTRFRDDVVDVCIFVDTWIDVAGGGLFTIIALTVLVGVDATATAMMVIPMLVVGLAANRLGSRLQAVHLADRRATAEVTGLLGDVVGAATTIKVNRAEESVLARLSDVMDHRKTTAIRLRLHDSAIRSFGQSTADIGLGLVIIVALGSLRQGTFGVGEIVLFLSYGHWLGFLPRMLGLLIARRQQAEVAFGEMSSLVADQDPTNTTTHRYFPFEVPEPEPEPTPERERRSLELLEVEKLAARFADGGIDEVSFRLARGSFTVVTGPVGSGKTTLLRTLLGLVWRIDTSGEVRWNGELIDDAGAFFIPPNAAYLPQVPQLVSDSLADNVLLGLDDQMALADALALAAVDGDIADMPDGAATMIGPRGLRLSGGQRQRVAAARALVQRPELLVLDDLSSAVDVETEAKLWDNLVGADTTLLVVSHRPVALERADQVLRLERGRLV